MRILFPSFLALCIFYLSLLPCAAQAENNGVAKSEAETLVVSSPSAVKTIEPTQPIKKAATKILEKFQPFTGKVAKNKVRMRLQSSYDGPVLRELNRNDLIVVLGETEDFYAIQPPSDFKGYVFRTFVLDNVIEGTRVNVRLKPELESPVVAQLNSGDHVEGIISPSNNKWLEILLPKTTRFYIAKEYIEKVGDAGHKARLEKKRDEAYQLLAVTEGLGKAELQKPFEQANVEGIKKTFQHIIADFQDFPEISTKGKEALNALQDAYIAKKMAFLENQTKVSSSTAEVNKKLSAELQAQKAKISHLEQEIENNRQFTNIARQRLESSEINTEVKLPQNISFWMPLEESLFHSWALQTGNHNAKEYYEEQKKTGFVLKGVIDSYSRNIKNKPGDFMLISEATKLPIAFLYSTHINLQEYIGRAVSIAVSPRENHDFAFPAYFVLSIE